MNEFGVAAIVGSWTVTTTVAVRDKPLLDPVIVTV
jgi:hypothetical protein